MVIFLDSGSPADIEKYIYRDDIAGVTTNPSLMKSAGVKNYREFAKTVLGLVGGKDVSLEVLASDPDEMYRQAMEIASWGSNIYVKIPAQYPDGNLTEPLLKLLEAHDVKLNVTALLLQAHAMNTVYALNDKDHIISIFCGRISDTGKNAKDTIWHVRKYRKDNHRVLWASARHLYNVIEARKYADIITLPPSLIDKLPLLGRNLRQYGLDTCRQFYEDGKGIEF